MAGADPPVGRAAQRDPEVRVLHDLGRADWNNSTIIRGDVAAEVTKLKQQEGGDLLVYGHGLLAETLLQRHLVDVLDISVHPIVAGSGNLLFREGQNADMKLVAV